MHLPYDYISYMASMAYQVAWEALGYLFQRNSGKQRRVTLNYTCCRVIRQPFKHSREARLSTACETMCRCIVISFDIKLEMRPGIKHIMHQSTFMI